MKNNIVVFISRFFTDYLSRQRGLSKKTVETYAYSLQTFIEYLKTLGISERTISMDCLNRGTVINYLEWLETVKKNSIATRNLRLAVLHSFCEYVINENIEFIEKCNEILKIKFKKNDKSKKDYIKAEDIKLLLSKPNIDTKKGIRDLTILSLLYDSGCRVSEFILIKKRDIDFKRKTISIFGKGRKQREVPISNRVVKIIIKYTELYKIDNDEYLFSNSKKEPLTRPGITYILNKYTKECKKENVEFFSKVITPHVLRRSKATHLLENNINIYYIRDFLGHESIQTTEIYAQTNTELISKALENHSQNIADIKKVNSIESDDTISSILSRFK